MYYYLRLFTSFLHISILNCYVIILSKILSFSDAHESPKRFNFSNLERRLKSKKKDELDEASEPGESPSRAKRSRDLSPPTVPPPPLAAPPFFGAHFNPTRPPPLFSPTFPPNLAPNLAPKFPEGLPAFLRPQSPLEEDKERLLNLVGASPLFTGDLNKQPSEKEDKDGGSQPVNATALASVQAALAALQAGQMSLNQVI